MSVNLPAKLPGVTPTPTPGPGVQSDTFTFIAGWILLIILLVFANKTRLGHVLIYYVLLLLILLILLTEYQQLAPLFNIGTIGTLNQ